MLPAATKPILEHVLDTLVDAGITDITIVVGYGRTRVQSHFGPTYRNVPLRYSRQEIQLGSGHALLAAESDLEGSLLVVNGDQLIDDRIVTDVIDAHDDGAAATLGLIQRSAVEGYGGVILEGDQVTELVERPGDERDYRLNAGVYAFEPDVFEAIRTAEPRAGEHSLVDGITELIASGREVRGVVSEGLWVDATYPWDLLDVSFQLLDSAPEDGGVASSVDERATVHESAVIREPVVIDADCEVGPGAVVGPYTCLGENVTVGSNAVVERSVVDADTRIGQQATLLECVTGVGVEVGAATAVPGGPGDVRVGDRVFEAERLGALLADHVRDNGGVTYVPGTVVGSNSVIGAGATVRGTLSEKTEVHH